MLTFGRLIGLGCVLWSAGGCATFWDEAMSNERDWSYLTGFGKPHPVTVIRDHPDGGKGADGWRRAQALGELREPLQNGGNAQDQQAYLDILGAAASNDSEPVCRLTAIRALGRYSDPRAARVLENVYQQPKLPFTADNNAMIRREALVALESSHDPESRRLLIQVARQPGPPTTADYADSQQTQDEKTIAIRALRHYKQPECVETLQYIMRTEKHVGLRRCAKESLEETTGKRWPEQYDAWQRDVQPLPPEDLIQKAGHWVPRVW